MNPTATNYRGMPIPVAIGFELLAKVALTANTPYDLVIPKYTVSLGLECTQEAMISLTKTGDTAHDASKQFPLHANSEKVLSIAGVKGAPVDGTNDKIVITSTAGATLYIWRYYGTQMSNS